MCAHNVHTCQVCRTNLAEITQQDEVFMTISPTDLEIASDMMNAQRDNMESDVLLAYNRCDVVRDVTDGSSWEPRQCNREENHIGECDFTEAE